MTNDAKLGMLAGVVGVLFAAVFLTKPPAQPAAPEPPAPAQAHAQPAAVPSVPSAPAVAPRAGAVASAAPAAFPSTPVVRTRKDVPAQPTSRQSLADEEP